MMKLRFYHAALPAMLALAACQPAVATYTRAEAPSRLTLSPADRRIAVRFVPGSARLAAGQPQRLQRLVFLGAILPQDRVLVAAGGPPWLAAAREAAISRALLPDRIVVHPARFPWVARNQAVISVVRTLVTLPPCPNWSSGTPERFNNQLPSNFGCATTSDLGLMVASPTDLVSGEPLGPADAGPAALSTNLYLANKVAAPGGAAAGGGAVTPAPSAGISAGGP